MRGLAVRIVTEALAVLRRDHALLLAIAGPFWFAPAFAVALLVPDPPVMALGMSQQAYAQALAPWLVAQAPWYLLDFAAALWGAATVYLLYGDPKRPTVGEAMRGGAALWFRLLLASALAGAGLLPLALVLAALPSGLGALPWTLATLWVMGRLMPVGPTLAAERPVSAIGAVKRAWRLTRGVGVSLAGVAAATLGLGWLLQRPFVLLEAWVRAAGGNPVAVVLVDAGSAAVAAAAALGSALFAVAAYRRLAR